MKHALTCPKCGGGMVWNIRTMRERGNHGLPEDMAVAFAPRAPKPLVPKQRAHPNPAPVERNPTREWYPSRAYGKYETLLCDRCGYTDWFARDFTPDEWLSLESLERGPCVECEGRTYWYIPTTRERDAAGEPTALRVVRKGFPKFWAEGQFSTFVCHGCGRTEWLASGLASLDKDWMSGVSSVDGHLPCRGCKAVPRWRIETMKEVGDGIATSIHVHLRAGFFYATAIGEFATEVCRSCGYTEWWARDYEGLRHDPPGGVALLERARIAQRGPYR
jgi:predicted nucleic-acid-binding Zn-ribbon protein